MESPKLLGEQLLLSMKALTHFLSSVQAPPLSCCRGLCWALFAEEAISEEAPRDVANDVVGATAGIELLRLAAASGGGGGGAAAAAANFGPSPPPVLGSAGLQF